MTLQQAPRVFISYSHDTVEHQERVLNLADRLRADGVDVEIDQYNAAPPEGWPLWCERQIAAADIVLMVCTETYHRRVSGDEERGKGLGVVCEARIIRQLLYDAGVASDKFVPVLFSDTSPEHIPTPIKGGTRYVVDTEAGYEDLYRRLTGQPHLLRPALGAIRPLPAKRRLWSEAQAEAATAPAPWSASRSSEDRGTAMAGGDRRVYIGGNRSGGAAINDEHNETGAYYFKATLPSVDRNEIRSELAALRELLVGLNTGDRTKIANALAEAADEAAKTRPDKNEIGRALERALGYAGKATDFSDKAGEIATHVQNAVAWLGDHWHKLLPLGGNRDRGTVNFGADGGRKLKIGVVTGLLFVLVVVLLQELRVIRQNTDWMVDAIMPYLAGVVQHPTWAKPFVFIAIDEESYRTWKEPWFTPRDKIAQIIETIADEHNPPLAIVVDINLSRASNEAFLHEFENPDSIGRVGAPSVRSHNEGATCDSLTNGNDKKLCQAIIDAAGKQIPVVLARDFNVGLRDPHSVGPLRPRASFLDPILGTAQRSSSSTTATAPPWASTSTPRVFWGSPLFNRDSDLTIRSWRLWERACVNDVIAAVPSVQLLVAALVQSIRVEDAVDGLQQSLRLSKQAPCSEEPDLITPQLQLEHLRVDLADKEFGQRIVFTLGIQHPVPPMIPLASSAEGGPRKMREEEVRLLEVISANRLTNTQRESLDPALFRDRIVVIGASYQDSGDIHATPTGPMAGAVMIINSIHTLLDYGQIRPPSWPIRILLNGMVVAIIALLFHVFNSSLAGFISVAMLFVAFIVINAITLPSSMLVDVSLSGVLFTFYNWFGSGFFNEGSFTVFRRGWDKTFPGWNPWRWRIRKALPAGRYHSSKQRGIINPNEMMGREHGKQL